MQLWFFLLKAQIMWQNHILKMEHFYWPVKSILEEPQDKILGCPGTI